jgi:hypothetical protein
MPSKKDQFKPADVLAGEDRAEILQLTDGKSTINATRKAFDAVYIKRGFSIVGEQSTDEKALAGSGKEGDPDDENLTPQQKAAKTRAAKKLAEESGAAE